VAPGPRALALPPSSSRIIEPWFLCLLLTNPYVMTDPTPTQIKTSPGDQRKAARSSRFLRVDLRERR
jgi:hypothetical protein